MTLHVAHPTRALPLVRAVVVILGGCAAWWLIGAVDPLTTTLQADVAVALVDITPPTGCLDEELDFVVDGGVTLIECCYCNGPGPVPLLAVPASALLIVIGARRRRRLACRAYERVLPWNLP